MTGLIGAGNNPMVESNHQEKKKKKRGKNRLKEEDKRFIRNKIDYINGIIKNLERLFSRAVGISVFHSYRTVVFNFILINEKIVDNDYRNGGIRTYIITKTKRRLFEAADIIIMRF
ncbi:hypothetical protein [Clostridium saccharoperbutylacetonicum]|uniref:hypothetical protein n=1 Tax=Clostridium saccharoperbutylacetonicum TaxID=36745 RepID=UPI0039ED88C1